MEARKRRKLSSGGVKNMECEKCGWTGSKEDAKIVNVPLGHGKQDEYECPECGESIYVFELTEANVL